MKMKLLTTLLISSFVVAPVFADNDPPPPDKLACLKHIEDRVANDNFTLVLNACQLQDADMTKLSKFLKKRNKPGEQPIFVLELNNNPDITATGLNILLPNTGNLLELDMNFDFGVGNAGAAVIGQITSLQQLNLHDINLTAPGAASLTTLTNLQHLDISFNDIQDTGAASIATMSSVTDLNVDSNNISATGATSIAGMTNVLGLVISNNFIGDAGAAALVRPGTFRGSLNLNSNHVGDVGAAALANNFNIITLSLENNDITDVGATSLSNNVDINGIFFLDLAYNRVGAVGIAALNAGKAAGRIKNFFVFGNLPSPLPKDGKGFVSAASFSPALTADFKKFCADSANYKICNQFGK